MSAFGTSTPPLRAPWGGVKTVGAAHTRVRHVAGGAGDACGLTPAPQPQSVGSPPTSKGKAATRLLRKP